jgi:nucleotide-binding universal stress UspA family protein
MDPPAPVESSLMMTPPDLARERHAAAIVIGSRGQSGFRARLEVVHATES